METAIPLRLLSESVPSYYLIFYNYGTFFIKLLVDLCGGTLLSTIQIYFAFSFRNGHRTGR